MEYIFDNQNFELNVDFDNFRVAFGSELTDDMISQSVHNASDFFHIDDPAAILTTNYPTGVSLHDSHTFGDDVLNISVGQLQSMGISSQDSLDLVMTHETAHRVLQGMKELELNSHQEELCCDFMSGVRAGLNDIDTSQMEHSLEDSLGGETHPAGIYRVEAIQEGVRFAQSYLNTHSGEAPSFEDCLSYFIDTRIEDNQDIMANHTIDETSNSLLGKMSAHEAAMQHYKYKIDNTTDEQQKDYFEMRLKEETHLFEQAKFEYEQASGEGNVKAYTQAEINRNISDAKSRMASAESNIRHNENLIKSKARMGEAYSFENYQKTQAQHDYTKAKNDLNRWQSTKPDK